MAASIASRSRGAVVVVVWLADDWLSMESGSRGFCSIRMKKRRKLQWEEDDAWREMTKGTY